MICAKGMLPRYAALLPPIRRMMHGPATLQLDLFNTVNSKVPFMTVS